MELPFTAQQFFEVFANYNESVWPAHIVLRMLAILAFVFLFVGQKTIDRVVMGILSGFWLWMGLGYHLAFFADVNPAARVFALLFVLQSVWFFWTGTLKGKVRFHFVWHWRDIAGLLLVAWALLGYPALSYWIGHRYPATPSFGLPCPTTIFTLGVLLIAKPPVPKYLFAIPLIWTVIGSVAAFQLGMHQDWSLLVAGLLALLALITIRRPARLRPLDSN